MGTTRAQPRTQRQAQTRRRLLDAARSVFGAQGFHGATLADVAAAAGMTKGAVYYNFAGKDDLFLALQDERFDALEEQVSRVRDAVLSGTGPAEAVVEQMALDRAWNLLFLEFVTHAARQPRFRRRLRDRLRRRRSAHAVAIEEIARAQGVELAVPAQRLAAIIGALANGLAADALVDPRTDVSALLGEGLDMLWRGARRPERAQPASAAAATSAYSRKKSFQTPM